LYTSTIFFSGANTTLEVN